MRQWTTLHKYMWLRILQGANAVYETVKGAIISFVTKKAAPLRKLSVAFSPVQDLHGYDSPWPAGGGKNKLPDSDSTATAYDVTMVESNGKFTLTGTATGSGGRYALKTPSFSLKAGTYYAKVFNETGSVIPTLIVQRGTGYFSGAGAFTLTEDADDVNIAFNVANGSAYNYSAYIGVFTENVTTYSPYSNICPILGWDSVNVEQRGKNLLNVSQANEARKNGASYFTLEYANNSVTMRCDRVLALNVVWEAFKIKKCHVGKTVTISGTITGGSMFFARTQNKNGDWSQSPITSSSTTRTYTITDDDVGRAIGLEFYNDSGADQTASDLQFELGSTPSEYTPYNPLSRSISITFPMGANKWDEEWELGRLDVNSGDDVESTENIRSKGYIPVTPSGVYYVVAPLSLPGVPAYNGVWMMFYDENKTRITSGLPSGQQQTGYARRILNEAITLPSNCAYVRFYCQTPYGTTYNHDIAINYPSSVTTYSPYTNTVYSGYVDVVTGVGEVNKQKHTFSAGDAWTYYDNGANSFFYLFPISAGTAKSTQTVITENGVEVGVNGNNGQVRVYLNNNPFLSADTDMASFMATYGFVYELATPIPIQLTPQEVQSLAGDNTMWSTANGDIEATYRSN